MPLELKALSTFWWQNNYYRPAVGMLFSHSVTAKVEMLAAVFFRTKGLNRFFHKMSSLATNYPFHHSMSTARDSCCIYSLLNERRKKKGWMETQTMQPSLDLSWAALAVMLEDLDFNTSLHYKGKTKVMEFFETSRTRHNKSNHYNV